MHIAREEKLAQLERILHGRTLHGSDNLKAFLRFVVDRSIENQEGQLKEYVIPREVFGRSSDFDSSVDTVVRVQAGRLRTKLHEYYETEGKDDGLIILLPKGQYTPVFSYAQKKEDGDSDGREAASGAGLAVNAISNQKEEPGISPAGYANGSTINASTAPPGGVVIESPRVNNSPSRQWQMATFALALMTVLLGALALIYRARAVEMAESVASGASGTRTANDSLDRR